MPGPRPKHLMFGPHAAKQIADTVRRVERASRSRQPHRRRSPPGTAGASIAFATLNATLNPGGNAAATFTIGGSGSVTGGVYDPGFLCTGDSLASGALVAIAHVEGKWYVIQGKCGC